MEAVSRNLQMIRRNGDFCETEVRNFIRELPDNQNITVVSIIGRQGSGKSYLLNRLFGTDFRVLDPNIINGQTTERIWIAKCTNNLSLVIMDVEGSDARNRAEDETTFESRAALLALNISDVLLLNIPAREIGMVYGGCEPLLRTIFKERVSFSPGRTRVVVTLRNCRNLTNMHDDQTVQRIIQQYWDSNRNNNRRFEDYFQLDELRKQLSPPHDNPLTAANFLNNVQAIWGNIRDRYLDIPSLNELMSRHRCEAIMQAKLSSLDSNEYFSELRNMQDATSPTLFMIKLDEFLLSTLADFDAKAAGFTEWVKDDFKARLKSQIVTQLQATFLRILMTKKEKILEEKKVAISNHLRNTKKGVLSSIFTFTNNLEAFDDIIDVGRIVNPHVRMFDYLFRDCCEEYKGMVSTFSNCLKCELKDYAEQEINEIEKHHNIVVGLGQLLIFPPIGASRIASSILKHSH